jgi:hypothetical protein
MCYDLKLILELWLVGNVIRNSYLILTKFKLGKIFFLFKQVLIG